MRLLDRYLLRELLIPLGFCLFAFLIFWISSDLFNEMNKYQEARMSFGEIVKYYAIIMPSFLSLVLPMALLLSLLYTLTNHARHHEITAMRAAGVSLARICVPYVAVGVILSLTVLAMNEFWIPSAQEKAEALLHAHDDLSTTNLTKVSATITKGMPTTDPINTVYHNLGFQNARDKRTWDIGSYNVETEAMTGPKVKWELPDGEHRLVAGSANYTNGVWTFYDIKEYEPLTNSTYLTLRFETNVFAHPEFSETPEQIKREIRFNKRLASANRAKAAEVPILDILDYMDLHPNMTDKNRWWLSTQLHGRLAGPWTCLIVIFIAIPFGAASGRRNIFVGVASSIFISFAYFVLLRLGLALGTGGYLPAWLAAWLPNLVFGAMGFWMMLRVR